MPTGRCAGCGYTSADTKVKIHALTCAAFLELHQHDPARCLAPATEYLRFKADDDNPAARARRRDERLAGRLAIQEHLAEQQANRWQTPPDILDD